MKLVLVNVLSVSFHLVSAIEQPSWKHDKLRSDGFDPEPNVTRANWMYPPHNRWAFKHITELQWIKPITKGSGRTALLPPSMDDMDDIDTIEYVSYDEPDYAPTKHTFSEFLSRSYTDAIVILHKGRVAYESYFDGQDANTRHILFSSTKSFCGLASAMLVDEGLLDPDAAVTKYIPELSDSGVSDATVREVMDMSAAFVYSEDYHDPTSEVMKHAYAMGWLDKPSNYTGPTDVREFLTELRQDCSNGKEADCTHGAVFTYRTAHTDILAWLIDKVLGANAMSAKYFTEKLWSQVGQEHDAFVGVDQTHFSSFGGSGVATARDMARYGEMMRNGGVNAWGKQVVPKEVVDDIRRGGTNLNLKQFAKSEEGSFVIPGGVPGAMTGWAYRNQYWVKPNHIFAQIGIYGQWCYVDERAEMVISKQSSFPRAVDMILDDETLRAFFALGKYFEKRGQIEA